MEKINVMINGLPGNVARVMAQFAVDHPDYHVIEYSLTGPDIAEDHVEIGSKKITLIKPDTRDKQILKIKETCQKFIIIDYTHPTAVNDNAEFYTQNNIPFVMGTTGGDRKQLEQTVIDGKIPAVIAPNMAKQIVGFQAMIEYAAKTFPGLFKGYQLNVIESHQQGKADTSGTAKAVVASFNELGVDFDVENIQKVRDPQVQKDEWNIPEEHLSGHGWHTYTLSADDGSSLFEFKHNINGRDIYASGTFDAVRFLNEQLEKKSTQNLFTMIDVLKWA